MAPPLRAPLLYTENGELPQATADALKALRPKGSARANGAQVIRLKRPAAGPSGLRVTSLPGADPILACSIDDYRSRIAGRPTRSSSSRRAEQYATAAAAWAAKSGDHRALHRAGPPAGPDRRGDPRPWPAAHLPARATERRLPRRPRRALQVGTVTRIAEADAPSTAVAFARFQDGAFGWGIVDPGHAALVFANPGRPGDGGRGRAALGERDHAPSSPLRAGRFPARWRSTCSNAAARVYSSYLVRGVYNHAWIVGYDGGGPLWRRPRSTACLYRPRQSQEAVSERKPTRSSAPQVTLRGECAW